MPVFGDYTVTDELYRKPFGAVYLAERAAVSPGQSNGSFVIKVFDADLSHGLDQEDAQEAEAFQKRLHVQQELTSAHCSHWAAVHDTGQIEEKSFWVTDYYPRTAQKLISGRVTLDALPLYDVISAIVEGLSELKSTCR